MSHNHRGTAKGTRKKSNSARKARRARNKGLQPERKLRRLLGRNQVADAEQWAEQHDALSVLRRIREA